MQHDDHVEQKPVPRDKQSHLETYKFFSGEILNQFLATCKIGNPCWRNPISKKKEIQFQRKAFCTECICTA